MKTNGFRIVLEGSLSLIQGLLGFGTPQVGIPVFRVSLDHGGKIRDCNFEKQAATANSPNNSSRRSNPNAAVVDALDHGNNVGLSSPQLPVRVLDVNLATPFKLDNSLSDPAVIWMRSNAADALSPRRGHSHQREQKRQRSTSQAPMNQGLPHARIRRLIEPQR
jgi:hypothetical protein